MLLALLKKQETLSMKSLKNAERWILIQSIEKDKYQQTLIINLANIWKKEKLTQHPPSKSTLNVCLEMKTMLERY